MLIIIIEVSDIIILNKQQKQAYLLDIAVPNSHNIKKQLKELKIKNEKQKTVNQFYSTCFPFYKIFSLE
jgi:hypothetical protein